jgi:hypothetical protein
MSGEILEGETELLRAVFAPRELSCNARVFEFYIQPREGPFLLEGRLRMSILDGVCVPVG